MQNVLEILQKCEAYFAMKGIPAPKLDAQILLAHTLGCKRLELFLRFDQPLEEKILAPFRELVKRRARREPLQHILGETDFFGLRLKCDGRALVPRPETEELADLVSREFFTDANTEIEILDLGTGSGALALSLAAHFKNSKVFATDFSDDAIALARENLEFAAAQTTDPNTFKARVKIFKSNWFENVEGTFNLIVSNPPYLPKSEFDDAQPEVKNFDPHSALVSDDEGFADLRKILSQAPHFLADGGTIVCECDISQPVKLAQEFAPFFSKIEAVNDLSRRPRFVAAKK